MATPSRVLVTGARGFLGREVVAELMRRYPATDIVAVSRRPPGPDDHPGPALDLSSAAAWRALDGRHDWVLHLASRNPVPGAALDESLYAANVLPARHLLDACHRWRPSRLIYVSSISVYPMGAAPVLHEGLVPRPDGPYGTAKLEGEHLAGQAAPQTSVAVLRPSSLYGPGQAAGSVLPLFVANAQAGKPIGLVAGGRRTQDFLHVTDAACAVVDAAASQAKGVYNVASGVATAMAELARIVTAQPGWAVDVVNRGGEEHGPSVAVDISKARRDWGYTPRISLTKGIEAYHAALLARLS